MYLCGHEYEREAPGRAASKKFRDLNLAVN